MADHCAGCSAGGGKQVLTGVCNAVCNGGEGDHGPVEEARLVLFLGQRVALGVEALVGAVLLVAGHGSGEVLGVVG